MDAVTTSAVVVVVVQIGSAYIVYPMPWFCMCSASVGPLLGKQMQKSRFHRNRLYTSKSLEVLMIYLKDVRASIESPNIYDIYIQSLSLLYKVSNLCSLRKATTVSYYPRGYRELLLSKN